MENLAQNYLLSQLSRSRVPKRRTHGKRIDFFRKYDENIFNRRFRLSKESFLYVLTKIEAKIRSSSERNCPLSPTEMLLLALRFYASGSFLISIADFCGVSVATASRVVNKVSNAIASISKDFIKMPNTSTEIENANTSFHQIAKFPKVIGCIDCTHVRIQSPGGENAEIFRNRKGYFSFNVQAVCNANLIITDLVCRWPGSAHDSNIFNNSRLKHRFEQNEFKECFLLGDSGYSVNKYMMTPLLHPSARAETLYNESQIRTRNCIERCFGVWKRRFPVLSLGLRLSQGTIMNIIVACGVLHNIARQNKDTYQFEEESLNVPETTAPFIDAEEIANERQENNVVRSNLIRDYFSRI
ncbi:putative nuclease HARBI1 isoform X2 [Rhagoletis pomonella]|uniref:putative nuclease HARBI1 isoform X2 n=1 Tax=Rhagoletis pomonella TaxID=28610 RepID=UPI00177E339F|nr:putative nuclease HARBI1 isoform X2 [Rhagoletis pomonella]